MMTITAGTLPSNGHTQALLFRSAFGRRAPRREPSPCGQALVRSIPRLRYEQCESGLRIVHETYGPGVIVRTSAQLVQIRPDRHDYTLLALAAQLRLEAPASRPGCLGGRA
jgi:hypothetical protein